jgi:hypothetical protein
MLKLKNLTKTAKTYNVPCTPDCDREGCVCTVRELSLADEAEDGTRGTRIVEKRIYGSITILGGGELPVEEWMLETPEVKGALARRQVRLVNT